METSGRVPAADSVMYHWGVPISAVDGTNWIWTPGYILVKALAACCMAGSAMVPGATLTPFNGGVYSPAAMVMVPWNVSFGRPLPDCKLASALLLTGPPAAPEEPLHAARVIPARPSADMPTMERRNLAAPLR